jgi:hypothetical protein
MIFFASPFIVQYLDMDLLEYIILQWDTKFQHLTVEDGTQYKFILENIAIDSLPRVFFLPLPGLEWFAPQRHSDLDLIYRVLSGFSSALVRTP